MDEKEESIELVRWRDRCLTAERKLAEALLDLAAVRQKLIDMQEDTKERMILR